jgi:hypothetical protein
MARDIRRTVAPAKVSPCQSAEKLCTRWKPSLVISSMFSAARVPELAEAEVADHAELRRRRRRTPPTFGPPRRRARPTGSTAMRRPALRPWLKLGRFDRPTGIWLLMLPGWQGIALAAAMDHRPPDPWLLLLFFLGAALMRAAGCAYNDIVDRDIDAKVARTAAGRSRRARSACGRPGLRDRLLAWRAS